MQGTQPLNVEAAFNYELLSIALIMMIMMFGL